jgi:hypothetical protein
VRPDRLPGGGGYSEVLVIPAITRMVLAKPDLPEPDCENGKHHRQGGQGTAGAQGVAGGQPVQPKQQPLGGGGVVSVAAHSISP